MCSSRAPDSDRLRSSKCGDGSIIHQQDDRGRQKDGEEYFGFGDYGRPEDTKITDRGKPQPINQEASGEPQQNKADQKDNGDDDERPLSGVRSGRCG
jgi:hypothetical protein